MTEFEKYRPVGPRYGRSVATGGLELVKGKFKKITKYEEYYKTQGAGEVELKRWTEKVLEIVNADENLYRMYQAIRKHMDTHIYFLHKEWEKAEWALECLYFKAYEYWPDFVYPGEEQTIIWL